MAHNTPYVTENIGDPVTIEPANPAVGTFLSVTVPAGFVWLLEQVGWTLTTDLNVLNRRSLVDITTATAKEEYRTIPLVVQPALTAYNYQFALQGQIAAAVGVNNDIQIPLPRYFIPPGSVIAFQILAIQVGDQQSAITYTYRQWQLRP